MAAKSSLVVVVVIVVIVVIVVVVGELTAPICLRTFALPAGLVAIR